MHQFRMNKLQQCPAPPVPSGPAIPEDYDFDVIPTGLKDSVWNPPDSVCPPAMDGSGVRLCLPIGRSFSLFKTRLIPSSFTAGSGMPFFGNPILNTVIDATNLANNYTNVNETKNSMERLTTKYTETSGGLGIKGLAYSVQADFEYDTGFSMKTNANVFTSDFETYRQNGALTLPDAYQITASNLHPDFIAAFTAFASNPGAINPVQGDYNYFITDDKVKAYKQFLDTWGTHVLIKVIVGRKYARHYSTADNTTNVQELMRARACAEASASFGTNSGTLQGCYGVTEEDIKNSYSLDVHENTYAWGGGQYGTELAALAQGNNCPPSGNLLIDFLSSPKNEDVAIAWEFKPIWDILAKMTTLSLEQKRCAEMLKLVFDYFMVNEALGFDNCTVQRIPASNGTIVRGVKVKNWNGTDPEFACWHVPNGCDSDAACRWRATGVRDNNQAECTAENGGQCYAWDALQKKVIQAPYQKNGGCEPKGPGDCPWYWKPCWGDWNHEANCRNNAQPGWESYTELSCINPAAGCGYIK